MHLKSTSPLTPPPLPGSQILCQASEAPFVWQKFPNGLTKHRFERVHFDCVLYVRPILRRISPKIKPHDMQRRHFRETLIFLWVARNPCLFEGTPPLLVPLGEPGRSLAQGGPGLGLCIRNLSPWLMYRRGSYTYVRVALGKRKLGCFIGLCERLCLCFPPCILVPSCAIYSFTAYFKHIVRALLPRCARGANFGYMCGPFR